MCIAEASCDHAGGSSSFLCQSRLNDTKEGEECPSGTLELIVRRISCASLVPGGNVHSDSDQVEFVTLSCHAASIAPILTSNSGSASLRGALSVGSSRRLNRNVPRAVLLVAATQWMVGAVRYVWPVV